MKGVVFAFTWFWLSVSFYGFVLVGVRDEMFVVLFVWGS